MYIVSRFIDDEVKEEKKKQASPCTCWFFTWPTVDHPNSGEQLYYILSKVCKAFGFQYEEGKDGMKHYQGQVQFSNKIRLPSKEIMDPDGILIFQDIHWERTKDLKAARHYCCDVDKPGFIAGPYVFGQIGAKSNGFTQALVAKDKESALKGIREAHPRDWYIAGKRIMEMVEMQFPPKKRKVADPFLRSSFVVPPHVDAWVGENIGVTKRRYPMLVMMGESMWGKTEWARSLGPHIYWKGLVKLDDLKILSDDCPERPQYIVVDDIDWKFVPESIKKSVLLGTGNCIVSDKYIKKLPVCVDIPCIYLMNPNEGDIGFDSYFFDESYNKVNTVVCKLKNKIY